MPGLDAILASYKDRVTIRQPCPDTPAGRCVVYWMQRAQRAHDNPAIDLAVDLANELRLPVVVYFAVVPYPNANLRHYAFMQQAFPDTARRLALRNVAFVLCRHPHSDVARFSDEVHAALLVGDIKRMKFHIYWVAYLPFFVIDL